MASPVAVSSKTAPSTAAPRSATGQRASVTPDTTLQKRMSVDKNIVDELLLVCGVLGTTDDTTGKLVPVEDCLNWLQDLQRALRRDDDLYRPISLLLGQWKVVQQKLLPLVLSCRYDNAMILTICKILVILTKPLSENTINAGRVVIDTAKTDASVVQEQIRLRENALQQAETLMDYKRAICHHSSHVGPKKQQEGGVLSVFVSLLAEPLSKQGNSRTDSDHLTIELVLHLFRNLLAAEPLLFASTETVQRSQQLHHEFISLLERELVLDIFIVLGAEIEQRENAAYNLLLMELLRHLLRHQDPTAVARSSLTPPKQGSRQSGSGLLKHQLQREKQSMAVTIGSRHSNFSGTLVLKQRPGATGRGQYMSTSSLQDTKTMPAGVVATRRKNKKSDPFIGATSGTVQAHRRGKEAYGPAAMRAQKSLDTFCQQFVKDCYGPFAKSLKNEFRRDSVRLEDGDRVVFFRVIWFFNQWWRAGGKKTMAAAAAQSKDDGSGDDASAQQGTLGQLIFTMDLFTFKLVLTATDTFQEHKKIQPLAQSVALLSEMMHLLHAMYQSKEPTEQLMAMGLMDRLFYGSEPMDKLPKLLSRWTPGTSTREYLCDLAEVCHMTLKLLDAHAKACSDIVQKDPSDKKKNKKKDTQQQDTIAQMKAAAADFDVSAYFSRKIVSNQTVYMYTQLLSQYATNAPQVNHRIIAFFLRICKVKVAVAEVVDPDMPKNLLATKTVTLEPMLYNVQLLNVLNTILNDTSIRKDKDYATTLSFASGIVHNFAVASSTNLMLFVEALFKHPLPHRFCELSTNNYVSEELRMLSERELLLEEQERFEREVATAAKEDDAESSEEELEFEELEVGAKQADDGTSGRPAEEETGMSKAFGSPSDNDGDSDAAQEQGTTAENGVADADAENAPINRSRLVQKRANDESSDEEDIAFDQGRIKLPQSKRFRSIVEDSEDDEEK